MNERDTQFLTLYQIQRYEDQQKWYESRRAEFDAAHNQAIALTIILMMLAALAAVLASADVGGLKVLWAVLAVIFPVFSTAMSAYDALYAFDRQAKLYQDAAHNLHFVRANSPGLRQGLNEAEYRKALGDYVNEVEGIFQGEQGQWGMLSKEIRQAEPPLPQS